MGDPENKMTRTTKYQAAVNKARGEAGDAGHEAQGNGALVVPVIPEGYGGMIGTYTPEALAERMQSGQLEWAPRVLKLEEGMFIRAYLEGRGGDVEMENVDRVRGTVEVKLVSTWIIRDMSSGLRASFLTAAQLEDKLPPYIGGMVEIYVGGMIESKRGHRYRDFMVGGDKLAGGATRTFARALPAPTIDVAANENGAHKAAGGAEDLL